MSARTSTRSAKSGAVTEKRPTLAAATKAVASLVGVGGDDAKRLSYAVMVASVEEVQHNSGFAERVRVAYNLAPTTEKHAGTSSSMRTPKALAIDLVSVKRVEGLTLNPAAPVDPYLVYEAYGADQLPAALDLHPLDKLKVAATLVEQRTPSGRRANRRSKATIIEYIVRELTANK